MNFKQSFSTAILLLVLTLHLEEVRGQLRMCKGPTPTVDGGTCTKKNEKCTFLLIAGHSQTMTKPGPQFMYADNYQLKWSGNSSVVDDSVLKDVVVADGFFRPRLVTVVNGTMPGPCLRLHKGQEVEIRVQNDLPTESLTIHWHGIEMRNTPYMDGVGLVTQCPILPGQSFTYTFTPDAPGTYWYHSHIGSTRSMGILGALIVLDTTTKSQSEDRVLILQDWNHDQTSDEVPVGAFQEASNQKITVADQTVAEDGTHFSAFPFQSGLINGRGRIYGVDNMGVVTVSTETPLDVIEVKKDEKYRFRVIAAGSMYPFRVAVQGHTLSVMASDGHEFKPVTAESFIINPGERYDFELVANQNPRSDYLIYAETLEKLEIGRARHVAEAILRYTDVGSTGTVPDLPSQRDCGQPDQPDCVVVNCHYNVLPEEKRTSCVLLEKLESAAGDDPFITDVAVTSLFLNFGFLGPGGSASVNGIRFQKPSVAAISSPKDIPEKCSDSCLTTEEKCSCAHARTLEYDTVYEIVLTNIGGDPAFHHPIHIHGYSFYVMKTGFPQYDPDSYKIRANNSDIICTDNTCSMTKWANDDGGITPGLQPNPIRKDTIIVPAGGYVVLRIKADNPGMWFVHCHIEMHHLSGMALMLDGTGKNLPSEPKGFPKCSSYRPGEESTSGAPCLAGMDLLLVLVVCVTVSTLRGRPTLTLRG